MLIMRSFMVLGILPSQLEILSKGHLQTYYQNFEVKAQAAQKHITQL